MLLVRDDRVEVARAAGCGGCRCRAGARAGRARGPRSSTGCARPRPRRGAARRTRRRTPRRRGRRRRGRRRRPAPRDGARRAARSAPRPSRTHGSMGPQATSLVGVPELPEMEITARRLDSVLPGERLESAMTPGLNVLKTFDPPLHAIDGGTFTGVKRRGKLLFIELATPGRRAADAAHPPDERGAAAAVRQARLDARPHVARAAAHERGPRAAPARVRHQAGGVGQAPAPGGAGGGGRAARRWGRRRGRSRRRTSASCSPPRGRCTRCCATSR